MQCAIRQQHPALMSLRVQWRQLGDACSLSRVFLRMILIVCLGNKFLIDDVGATHATRTFDRPSTPHPSHPYNADFVENFVITLQKDAEQHSNALISTDDFNTPVSTGTYSDVPQHEKSLNTYQHTMAASNRREGSNFGHLPDAYAHFRLWDDRFTPASGEAGILDYPRDVPHRWAYFQGSEGTTPCEVTPFEQGRCVIDLPYVVQQASGDKVHFVAGLNKIEAEQLARLNGVWLLDQTDPNAVI